MRDIASHIYDISENSINANAKKIQLEFVESEREFCFSIQDDGCGMDKDMLEMVKDPFVTTRQTRKVGLGIPLLIQNCEATGGNLRMSSELGKGTHLTAVFNTQHIDCPPLGDVADVMVNLVIANPNMVFEMKYVVGDQVYVFNTEDINEALNGMPITTLEVVSYLKAMVKENVDALHVTINK